MAYLIDRMFSWISADPALGLLLVVTALVLFSTAFRRNPEKSNALWPWIRRIIESSVGALLFLALLWTFRSILINNNTTFNSTHGSLTNANLSSAQSIWGRPHVQRELGISHWYWTTEKQEIPRAKPDDPPQYKDVPVRVAVPQNSIIGFDGKFDLTMSQREKGYGLYNGFIVDATLTYYIINDSQRITDVDFFFPLPPQQTLFENFKVLIDDDDQSSALRYGNDAVQWQGKMDPQQKSTVVITYRSRGMSYFYYQIPAQRQIANFALTVTIDKLPTSLLNYPDGVLSPTEVKATPDGQGSILTWKLDRAITTAGMGVALPQPDQPGINVFRVLNNSPYAVTMLVALIAVTLMLLGEPIHFLDLALLAGTYSVQFLFMAAVSDYVFGFWGSLIIGALITITLTFLIIRNKPPQTRLLILGLTVFFGVIYPLGGLLLDLSQANAFETFVQLVMALYIIVVALRQRRRNSPPTPSAAESTPPASQPVENPA